MRNAKVIHDVSSNPQFVSGRLVTSRISESLLTLTGKCKQLDAISVKQQGTV